jgi:hypothetical protein
MEIISGSFCKYLGSLLDTKEYLTRRKQLAHISFTNKKNILTSNGISLRMRMRVFNSFVTLIFLYNSELWTLNKKMEKEIDVFQQKMFRRLLKIRWPRKISNEELRKKTQDEQWSTVIKQRRLKWFGHLLRLPDTCPARLAYKEAVRQTK